MCDLNKRIKGLKPMLKKKLEDRLMRNLKSYQKMIKSEEKVFSVEKKIPPAKNQLRMLAIAPPIYVALLEEISFYNEKIFKAFPLTEEIDLGYYFPLKNPIFSLRRERILLCALPIEVYFMEDFLYHNSFYIGTFDFSRFSEFLERRILPPLETPQGKYLQVIKERLKPFNVSGLLESLKKIEEIDKSVSLKIELPQALAKRLSEEYGFALSASGKNVFKGENFLAYLERKEDSAVLVLYLPEDYLGRRVKITLKGETLFEGWLETHKLILEKIPLLSTYSFLEEELSVQVY